MPTRNVALLRQVADAIDAHPEMHNQDFFFAVADQTIEVGGVVHKCATTMCVAGWACALAGRYAGDGVARDASGELTGVADLAADLLGLTWEEGQRIFFSFEEDTHGYAEMLRAVANGAHVEDAMNEHLYDVDGDGD